MHGRNRVSCLNKCPLWMGSRINTGIFFLYFQGTKRLKGKSSYHFYLSPKARPIDNHESSSTHCSLLLHHANSLSFGFEIHSWEQTVHTRRIAKVIVDSSCIYTGTNPIRSNRTSKCKMPPRQAGPWKPSASFAGAWTLSPDTEQILLYRKLIELREEMDHKIRLP